MTSKDLPCNAPLSGRRRVAVIINPATCVNVRTVKNLLQQYAPPDVDLDIHETPAAGTTTSLAKGVVSGAWAVIAVGGDGTVGAVATALYGSDVPLGVIPSGTTNIIARQLGIPTTLVAAVKLIFGSHHRKRLDVGVAGERCFVHMAGAGFDSRMFIDTNMALKRRVGWLAHLPPAVRNLVHPPAHFTIVTDGVARKVTSLLVLVANGSGIITPRWPVYPEIWMNDGWLDVVVVTATRPLQIARMLARFATHGLARCPYVFRVRARRVELHSEPRVPVEMDGEVMTRTPVCFEIAPGALSVIAPHNGR